MKTQRRLSHRLNAYAVALLSGLALVSGCSNAPTPASSLPPEAKRSFDLFLGDKLGLIDYAQQKVRNKCLADVGYPQNQQTMLSQPRNPFSHLIITARTFGPATEEEARRLGFGRDLNSEPASIVSYDANYDKNLDVCEAKAWEQLGKDAQRTLQSYFDLGNKLAGPLQIRLTEAIPPDLSQKLYDCLVRKDYKATDPHQFLKAPLPELFGIRKGSHSSEGDRWQPTPQPGTVQVSPPYPAREYIPTAEEADFAVAWFQCRQDAKLTAFQLEQAEKLQRELVTQHETTFTEMNPKIEDLARKAAALVGDA